ncbi:dipeptide/oligopeptide/nickel ABC transporter permease/ATP-binding protein [Nocardioides thalensis]|nr:dipeptide/oligopeptide/nickel ABC transporter permease/ATP-binding protein [Nocardioides thalensis]
MHQGPSADHWLGTDALGRDVLARVLVAARLSVLLALAATALGTIGGVLLGCLPFLLGRRLGRIAIGAIDLAVSFPGLLVAIFLAVIVGVGPTGAVIALGVAMVPNCARLTYTMTAAVAASNYVTAARALGVGRVAVIRRHIVPNIAEPLLITTASTTGSMLLAFAGLSYLGFGVQAPSYDWGRLLNEGLAEIYVNPAAALGPGVAVVLAGIVFSLVGEWGARAAGIRDDGPRSRRRRTAAAPPPEREPAASGAALVIDDLTVAFGEHTAVRGLSLSVGDGEVVGIVGESGSGKSVTAMAVADLLPPAATVQARDLAVDGRTLRDLGPRARRDWLAERLGVVFQNPLTALNPTMRIGDQVVEGIRDRDGTRRAPDATVALLERVRMPAPAVRARQRPHELSGGMRQRAVIAIGIATDPKVVIADEPTTALDVRLQKHVLTMLEEVRAAAGATLLLISHDLAVVSTIATRVVVMYGGRVMEDLPVGTLHDPAHPYTAALLRAVPDLHTDVGRDLVTIEGRPPASADALPGCPFAPRCDRAEHRCHTEAPPLLDHNDGHRLACWNPVRELATRACHEAMTPTGGRAE